jgi:acyl carrier protein
MGLDAVEIVLALEAAFGIRIPNRIAPTLRLVGDLEESVLRLRSEQLAPATAALLSDEMVRNQVKQIIADEMSLPVARVHTGALLVAELGIDA